MSNGSTNDAAHHKQMQLASQNPTAMSKTLIVNPQQYKGSIDLSTRKNQQHADSSRVPGIPDENIHLPILVQSEIKDQPRNLLMATG